MRRILSADLSDPVRRDLLGNREVFRHVPGMLCGGLNATIVIDGQLGALAILSRATMSLQPLLELCLGAQDLAFNLGRVVPVNAIGGGAGLREFELGGLELRACRVEALFRLFDRRGRGEVAVTDGLQRTVDQHQQFAAARTGEAFAGRGALQVLEGFLCSVALAAGGVAGLRALGVLLGCRLEAFELLGINASSCRRCEVLAGVVQPRLGKVDGLPFFCEQRLSVLEAICLDGFLGMIRRLANYLPLSAEYVRAASLSEMAERGQSQADALESAIEGDFEVVAPNTSEDDDGADNNDSTRPESHEQQQRRPEAPQQSSDMEVE